MARLFAEVAAAHSVSEERVREAFHERPITIDLLIALPYLFLYLFALNIIISRIKKRDHDQLSSGSFVLAYASIVTSAAAVLLGEAWWAIAETVRLGNGHLSYRTDRNPWAHHYLILFAGALVVFWCVFVLRMNALCQATRTPSTESSVPHA